MGKTKNKKESPVLNDYPNGIPIAPKFPTTKEEIIQVQKANMDYLCSMAKYDTLRSATIIIDDYGAIPVYALEFEYLKQEFPIYEIPMNEYAEGYIEGLKTQNFIPFIDKPKNRKEKIIEALSGSRSFPVSENWKKNSYPYK